jgi:hypothetical protein
MLFELMGVDPWFQRAFLLICVIREYVTITRGRTLDSAVMTTRAEMYH